MTKRFWAFTGLCASGLLASPALGGLVYSEFVDGDLSNDPLATTPIALATGDNFVLLTTTLGDRDFFTITIPAGFAMSRLELSDYEGDDQVAFGAFMPGPSFTEDPDSPNPANMSGLAHFGTIDVGQDLLPLFQAGLGFPVLGFSVPLPSGQYSFWVQQIGAISSIGLNFVVEPIPAPGAGGVLFAAGLLLAGRRRRV